MAGDQVTWQEERRRAYLARWPYARQLEALVDAARGDDRLITELRADFASIRKSIPACLPVDDPELEESFFNRR